MKNYLFFLLLFFASLIYGQGKEYPPLKPKPFIFSHLLNSNVNFNGKIIYSRKSDNYILNDEYKIYETKKKINTDIVDSFYNTGFIFQGKFNNGYKNGFWKTTYKNKLVKTENYINGLAIGSFRVYNMKGALLYKTTFGLKGNGKYKNFYYKTGILKEEGNYENGKKEGEWCTYNEKGNTKEIVFYEKGNPIKK